MHLMGIILMNTSNTYLTGSGLGVLLMHYDNKGNGE